MTASDTHTAPPSANGDLVNRVQQLRLDGHLGAAKGGGGGSWLPWILCGLLAVSWAGVGVRSYRAGGITTPGGPAAQGPSAAAPAPATPTPDAPGPTAAPGEILLQLKGNLIPSLQIAVSPRDVAGELTKITFWEGKLVTEGEVLAQLLDSQYANRHNTDLATVLSAEAQVARSEAGVAAAKVRVAKAESAQAAAKARVTRAVAVQDRAAKDYEQARLQRAGSAISAQEFQKFEADNEIAAADKIATDADLEAAKREVEASKAEVTTAEAGVAASKAEVTAARSRLAESKRLLTNCTIVAPISGTVLTKTADKGSLVSPAAFNVSASLCEIADLSKLEVEVDVPERQVTKVREGLDCQVVADADSRRVYRGYVDRVMPIADDTKNVIKVRVR